jgi:Ca2+-binding EF-hand superfamily protein
MSSELTAQQLQEMRQSFDIIDRDGDGFINIDDLSNLFAALGSDLSQAQIEAMLKENDVDGSEKIDFPGFLAIMVRDTKQSDVDDELREAFRTLDADSDGFITLVELKKFLTQLGFNISNDVVKRLISEADRNRDNKLDFAEFRTAVLSN